MVEKSEEAKVVKSGTARKVGNRYGGREKGTPNKNTQTLREKAEQLGVDPFEIQLLFAKGDWSSLGYPSQSRVVSYTKDGVEILQDYIQPDLRLKAACEATKYLEPQRKAIEHSGPGGAPIQAVTIPQTKEELEARIKALLEKREGAK